MCKDWGIETDALLRECYALTRDVDYGQMAWVHDEYQYEHREEGFGQIIQEASARAISITAEKFDFRGKLATDGKTGLNWYDCH